MFPNEINLISEWLAMTGFSVSCRELLLCSTLSGNGVEIVRGGDALSFRIAKLKMQPQNLRFLEQLSVLTVQNCGSEAAMKRGRLSLATHFKI